MIDCPIGHELRVGNDNKYRAGSPKSSGFSTLLEMIPPNTFTIALNAIQKEPSRSKNGTDIIQIESRFHEYVL